MGKLNGKVAIVTGSGRGIGRAIAMKLATEGASVVVTDLDAEPAQAVVKELVDQGHEASVFVGDVTEEDFGEGLVAHTLTSHGGLDILVNNAGYIWNSVIQKNTDEQWYAMIDVHATAPFRILRAAFPYFRESASKEQASGEIQCRKIVNVSSVSGTFGAATQLAYSAGKAAVLGMTKTLSKEWGRYNITVNCVAFGHIETRLTQPFEDEPETIRVGNRDHNVGLTADTIQELHAATPLQRGGNPEDAAGAVYLFCIPESDFITGETLVCSGGLIG